jgi:hypothetical protein
MGAKNEATMREKRSLAASVTGVIEPAKNEITIIAITQHP